MSFLWPEASWADIEYHIGTGPFLRVKAFEPTRTADYVEANRRVHDQITEHELVAISDRLLWTPFGVTLKLSPNLHDVSYIDIPEVARIYKWSSAYKRFGGKTFIASTYLNQCNYYARKT